ncbi:MAG TPA: hypothetical protein VI933_01165 [archaeon]|nr:hypothetical protein [archaeon]
MAETYRIVIVIAVLFVALALVQQVRGNNDAVVQDILFAIFFLIFGFGIFVVQKLLGRRFIVEEQD